MRELSRRMICVQGAIGFTAAILADDRGALAHHGFGGRYLATQPIYLEGAVRTASFRPPHPTVSLAVSTSLQRPSALAGGDEFLDRLVVRQEDRGRLLDIEFPPVGLFFGLADRVRTGDAIAVVVYRNCNAPHQLRGQWIRLADGGTVVRSGRMQTEVQDCTAT